MTGAYLVELEVDVPLATCKPTVKRFIVKEKHDDDSSRHVFSPKRTSNLWICGAGFDCSWRVELDSPVSFVALVGQL